MLKTILAISGKPGLYKLVSNGRNMLIVESLATGKRTPAYSHDKIVSLGDIAIYTTDEDVPLSQVFDAIKVKNDGKTVDMSSFADDHSLRAYFRRFFPTSMMKECTPTISARCSTGITSLSVPELPNLWMPRGRMPKKLLLSNDFEFIDCLIRSRANR